MHGEDSHNQSSALFKDKLRSWRGVGAANAAEQPVERAVLFAPLRPTVPSLEGGFPGGEKGTWLASC